MEQIVHNWSNVYIVLFRSTMIMFDDGNAYVVMIAYLIKAQLQNCKQFLTSWIVTKIQLCTVR